MPTKIEIGTATSQPGSIQYGRWEMFTHPTGHVEWLPVIIAQGKQDGPCIWLTAGIHGPEHSGPSVIYKLLTEELVTNLKGTIIALPALTPSGLRTGAYVPHHEPTNPNRYWPDGRNLPHTDPEKRPPTAMAEAFSRLFDHILETADFLIDYHNASIGSIPFIFRDRVLYRQDGDIDEAAAFKEAEHLSNRLSAMINAFGMTVINEYPVEKYIDEDLHRSTSGAALLVGRIPAFTVELGVGPVPSLAITTAAVIGTRNVMRWAGMLGGLPESQSAVQRVDPGYPIRRTQGVRLQQACILLHVVDAGDIIKQGDIVAEMRDVWGQPLGDGVLRSPYDGLVWSRPHGIYRYPGETAIMLARRDDTPLVGPYPAKFFEEKG